MQNANNQTLDEIASKAYEVAENAKHALWKSLAAIKDVNLSDRHDDMLCPRYNDSVPGSNFMAFHTILNPFVIATGLIPIQFEVQCIHCTYLYKDVNHYAGLDLQRTNFFRRSPAIHTVSELIAAVMHSTDPMWTTIAAGQQEREVIQCPMCTRSQSQRGNDLTSCVITRTVKDLPRHIFVRCSIPDKSPQELMELKLNTELWFGLDQNSPTRHLDRIVIWKTGNHFQVIAWINPTAALPCQQGWYFFDGMTNNGVANTKLQPQANTVFLGPDNLGQYQNTLYLETICVLVYSAYTDPAYMPKFTQVPELRTDRITVTPVCSPTNHTTEEVSLDLTGEHNNSQPTESDEKGNSDVDDSQREPTRDDDTTGIDNTTSLPVGSSQLSVQPRKPRRTTGGIGGLDEDIPVNKRRKMLNTLI
jgi:hypothetical protein